MYQGVRISGFGGQGVVSAGVLLAQAGLVDGKAVSWYPSYGPEMRGGTANCSVVMTDTEVATPVVAMPDTAIIMNEPSLPKFEPLVKKGGLLIINTSLVKTKATRTDIKVIYVPCNEIAEKVGSLKAANLVALGTFAGATGAVSIDAIANAMKKVFKRAKPEILELNRKALEEGAKLK
ncbi:MAG: 2-oxoacid:acceptor oxidoreductase family protein [Elusimicrobiota bacterium]|jgi:2-oxoglutarate ferredoxin oxidoreductase subunit gamma|nr:2-oxoacid:acceptor oxidoreductase family protein [Elusimicrobiota bacterium]